MGKKISPKLENKPDESYFHEVEPAMSIDAALQEASRCFQCYEPPCRKNCPANIDIPVFIRRIKERDFAGAAQKIKEENLFGGLCARVCPVDRLCEGECTRKKIDSAINIHSLQRFAADWEEKNWKKEVTVPEEHPQKVAVVGAGPAGLACAFELRKMGYRVTVFEKQKKAGGIPSWGIPPFRAPREIVKSEVDFAVKSGIDLRYGSEVVDLAALEGEFDAVFLGCGLDVDIEYPLQGPLEGVFSASQFLRMADEGALGFLKSKKVGVVGGGDVAFDVARTAVRLGGECTVIYRRTFAEMPAERRMVEAAMAEGVNFKLLTTVVEFLPTGKGNYRAKCQVMRLEEADESGRRKPVPVEGATYHTEFDCLVLALGSKLSPEFYVRNGIELDRYGKVKVDDNMMTSRKGVFAGGDLVSYDNTVVRAVGDGKKAARAIAAYLRGES
ncbi:FAD-dependent oxidoreductase [Candidatus Hecatella orcuttiae]|uniref:FAD-dependent oxidoreductase n=1 Tax=Candidatus Hecatella orcuttiae TaxID=1935119 RepID=UPI002868217D|nr:FAD-dependent oxidoreductase [Candidatus Hecatella orcuttiae]